VNLPEATSAAEFRRPPMRAPPLDLNYHLPICVWQPIEQIAFMKIRM